MVLSLQQTMHPWNTRLFPSQKSDAMKCWSTSNTPESVIQISTPGKVLSASHQLTNTGDWPLATKANLVGGHEGAGIVVDIGSDVTNIELGDHVGIKWLNGSCGNCEFCLQSFEPNCPYALLSGYTVDGSFQQYCIGKAAHVARIPKSVDLADAASVLCAGITVYKALKESGARPGQWVALPGAGGGLGHLAVQYALAMGLRVVAIDTGKEKKTLVRQLGAEAFVDFVTSPDIIEEVVNVTGGGAHAVIVISANSKSYSDAQKMARTHGTVVAVGLPAHTSLGGDVFDVVVRNLTVKGSYV